MKLTEDRLKLVFDRTNGRCHICGGGLCFANYGKAGQRGAWEVEHSVAKCKGGTDQLNNLYAAHIACNRAKGTKCTRTARAWHDRTKAPLSARKKEEIRSGRTWGLGALGLAIGAASGAIVPALLLATAGAAIGHAMDPEG